jgi:hypothetical protein
MCTGFHHFALAAAAFVLAVAGPAVAQPPEGQALPAVADEAVGAFDFEDLDDITLVEELVVVGVRPGPAFWKVADEDSVVWVLGVPSAFPPEVEWNQDEMRAHLNGANLLINGAGGITINLLNIGRIVFTMNRFEADRPLSQALPPDLYARFQAAEESLSESRRIELEELKPGYAAFFLSGLFERSLEFENGQPEQTITRAARFRVRQQRVGRSGVIDILRLIENMPPDVAQTCIEDAVNQVEAGPERPMEAARGWARGDLTVALKAERGFERCLSAYPEIQADNRENIEAVTSAILGALERPGKSVALTDLRPLLSQDGILIRLMSLPHLTITPPDVPGLEGEIGAEMLAPEGPPIDPEA